MLISHLNASGSSQPESPQLQGSSNSPSDQIKTNEVTKQYFQASATDNQTQHGKAEKKVVAKKENLDALSLSSQKSANVPLKTDNNNSKADDIAFALAKKVFFSLKIESYRPF